jgi:hypothetical protein
MYIPYRTTGKSSWICKHELIGTRPRSSCASQSPFTFPHCSGFAFFSYLVDDNLVMLDIVLYISTLKEV